jgi:hypothetical protein
MAVGVRKTDTAFRDRLQGAIDRHPTEIAAILRDYGIPTVPPPSAPQHSAAERAGLPPPTQKSGG